MPRGFTAPRAAFTSTRRVRSHRAIITHGHADHARPGHGAVLATPETIAILKTRLGETAAGYFQALPYGEPLALGGATVRLVPAGHILGSAQVVIEHQGARAVVSGDYKLEPDPTAAPFELVRCDLFVTEATFGLPVFHHEPDDQEVGKLLTSVGANPDRTHLIGAYGLGKTQRLIALLRAAGYDRPIWFTAPSGLCDLYRSLGVDLGELAHVNQAATKLPGEIVLCPPSALQRPLDAAASDPFTAFASGWMRVRARARQRASSCRWSSPITATGRSWWRPSPRPAAEEIWVTHGREDALVHQIGLMGRRGRALALIGYEDNEGE